MLYVQILEQKEIIRLTHVLVLVSLTDKVSMFVLLPQEMVHIPQIIDTLSRCVRNEEIKFVNRLYRFVHTWWIVNNGSQVSSIKRRINIMITNLQTQGAKFIELLSCPDDERFSFIVI